MAIKKVWIEEGCISCGMSETNCPEVFKIDDEQGSSQIALLMAITLMQDLCMKVWHLLIGSIPRDMFQKKTMLEPLNGECGLESLWLRGLGVRVKD